MELRRIGRRHFLVGAGGFTLALPFLGSLLTRKTQAGDPPFAAHPRFVTFTTNHGGIWRDNMFPAQGSLTESTSLFSDHTIRTGALSATRGGGTAALSPVLTANDAMLPASIEGKLNVIRGLDIPFYIAHHTGGFLGNFARNDGEGEQGYEHRPTIDQVLAYSPSFYPDIGVIRERSMHVGAPGGARISFTAAATGVQPVPNSPSALDLFNRVFVPDAEPGETTRTPVVDRVYEHYAGLRNGTHGDSSRLSAADRRRIDDFMDRLAEVQRRLAVVPATCGDVLPPGGEFHEGHPGIAYQTRDVEASASYYQAYNDVLAAAFVCGTSRVATVQIQENLSTDPREWHDAVAHRGTLEVDTAYPELDLAQDVLVASHRLFFSEIFLDLARKLDVEETDGVTFLDNSLLMWTQESGNVTHNPYSIPIITAGSAAGVYQTGRFYDYTNDANLSLVSNEPTLPNAARRTRPGLLYQQWLGSILTACGVPQTEWGRAGEGGYGLQVRGEPGEAAWPQRVFDMANDHLPLMTA